MAKVRSLSKYMRKALKLPRTISKITGIKADIEDLNSSGMLDQVLGSFGVDVGDIEDTINSLSVDKVKEITESVLSGELNPKDMMNEYVNNYITNFKAPDETKITEDTIKEEEVKEQDIGADMSDTPNSNYKGADLDMSQAGPSSVSSNVTYSRKEPNVASVGDDGHKLPTVKTTGGKNDEYDTTGPTNAMNESKDLWSTEFETKKDEMKKQMDAAKILLAWKKTKSNDRKIE